MKKWILTIICISNAFLFTSAQNMWGQLERAIVDATMHHQPYSAGASHNGGVKIYLNQTITFENTDQVQNQTTPCIAVRITPDYLLTTLACKTAAKQIVSLQDNNTAYQTPRLITEQVNHPTITSINVGNQTLTSFTEDMSSQLLLIKLNAAAKETLRDTPIVDLFFINQQANVIKNFHKLLINSNLFLGFRAGFPVALQQAKPSSSYVKIDSNRGATGDPLVGMTHRALHHEFLLGFNVTPFVTEQRATGNQYRLLDKQAKHFIQQHIDAAAWTFLQRHTIDETFFK